MRDVVTFGCGIEQGVDIFLEAMGETGNHCHIRQPAAVFPPGNGGTGDVYLVRQGLLGKSLLCSDFPQGFSKKNVHKAPRRIRNTYLTRLSLSERLVPRKVGDCTQTAPTAHGRAACPAQSGGLYTDRANRTRTRRWSRAKRGIGECGFLRHSASQADFIRNSESPFDQFLVL